MTKPKHNGEYFCFPSYELSGHFVVQEAQEEQDSGLGNWDKKMQNEKELARAIERLPKLLEIERITARLLRRYQNKTLVPPDKYPDEWAALERLLEK